MNNTITSLFSGCGGLDLGFHGNFEYLNQKFEKLNFETIFANDVDKNACITFSKNFNNQIICDDIRNIEMNNLEKSDIVIGGFPCQDFSHAGKRLGFESERGNLYKPCAMP